jgi:hypothetical protein
MFRVRILAFIDAFAKFREATVSIVMSVRPHVHPQEQLGTTWTVFLIKLDILGFFENVSNKFNIN